MERKVEEFVQMMIKEYTHETENPAEWAAQIEEKLLKFEKILKKKTFNLMESIFQFDSNKWFRLLLIENPSVAQR